MQGQFCNADGDTSLAVEIVESYDPPSTFTLSPPSYRAASPLSLTCEVKGLDDYTGVFYQWSSTCTGNCFSKLGASKTVSTDYLHSYDTVVHTCMVWDTLGYTGNKSISVEVVGAGVFVETVSEALPNNSLITTVSTTQNVTPEFRCVSGSSKARVGRIIGPLGNDITFLTSDPFLVTQGSAFDPGTLLVRTLQQLDLNDTGIYTYRTPDEKANMIDFNFGIYLHDYADPPICSDLEYVLTEDLHTLTCVSHGSPPTQVMWERNGERIYQNDTHYQLSQILVERTSSTYNNTLTINGTIEDVVGEYSCTVSNTLGSSNEFIKTVQALEVSGHESPVIVGLIRSVICSIHLEVTKMEWLLVGVAEPVEQREDGGQNLTLLINPTNTGLDGAKFTCKVTLMTGKVFEETITVEVKELTHTVDITGSSNPLSPGGKYTFTCTVTSDLSPTVKWLDPDNNEVDGSDVAVVMDDMVANGNTTTLLLHFDPLKTSHGGTYACVSTISEPTSFRRMTRDLEIRIASDSTSVTRSPSGTIYTYDEASLTCVTTVNEAVGIPVQVTHQWVGPGGVVSTNSLVSVSSVTSSGRDYSSTVFFSSLHSSHSGTYTCSSTVSAVEASDFIVTSAVQTASTSFDTTISVTIEITYSSPGIYSPPNYRAASAVTLKCVASGYSGSISYHWTSTCTDYRCFANNKYSQTISDNRLVNYDAGVHTCSVTDGLGNTGSNSTIMRIVGIGIFVHYAHSSHTSSTSGFQGAQPSNSFLTVIQQHESNTIRVNVLCCSNTSSTLNVNTGSFIIPTGDEYSNNFGSYIHIHRNNYGCIRLHYHHHPSSQNFYPSHHNYDGIHTCKLPDSNGNYLYENFGIYDQTWDRSLSISQLEYSTGNGLLTLTCKTRNSPPSIIRWYRDNNLLDIDGSDYNMSVSVTNRHNSRFNIQLIVCGTVENMVGTYKCEAGNRHGMDYEFRHISGIDGLQVQCNKNSYVVGETVTCSCTNDIGSQISWTSSTGTSISSGSLSIPVSTDSHGDVYTCTMSSSCGVQEQESVTVAVTVPDVWATVDIQNSTGENALNNTDYILTCTVTVIEGITLPVTVEWVGPDGDVVTSEGNRMVGEVEVQGRVSTLSLSFSPVYFSDGGNYTCRTAISVPWLSQQPQRMTTVEMPVTTQAMFQLKMYPLTHCSTWKDSAHDVEDDLEQNIKREVEKAVRERCNCAFSSSEIYSGEFSCQFTSCEGLKCDLATYVTYRAVLNGTSDLFPANQLMGHIQDWLETEGTLLYDKLRLRLVSECDLNINSFHDREC